MFILLLMNFIVALTAFLVTYRLFRISNLVDSLISCFIVYLAQIVLCELILGIFGALYLNNVLLVNLLSLVSVWFFARSRPSSFSLGDIAKNKKELLGNRVVLFILSVIFCFSAVKIIINLVNPPFGWDSLNYHFTFAVEWLKHGNLDIPITVFDDPSPSYYPINGSLFYLWLMLPLKNVFLADLGQLPFFILSVLAVYSISRKIGLNRELSFYAAALFLLIPNFFKQLQIAYVDVMVAGLFLACLNSIFLLNENFSCVNALVYGMSLGLLIGTKTIALPYSVILFIPFIYLAFKNLKKAHFALFAVLAVMLLGGFAYLRNFIQTANPFYPLDFRLLGKSLFKGVITTVNYRAHFRIEDYALSKLLFHEGLGMQLAVLILPAVLMALPVTLIKKRKILNFNLIYFLILPFLIFLVYRFIIPLANTRYLYSALGIGSIIGFHTLEMLKLSRKAMTILVIIFVLASIPELAKRSELLASIISTILLFSLSPSLINLRLPQPKGRGLLWLIFSFVVLLALSLILLEKGYIKNEYPGYAKMVKYSGFWPDAAVAWDWLNKNTSGNNIAYAGRPVPFPLYGSNFKNSVFYVSVNKIDPAKLHYFPESRYKWGYDFLGQHRNLEAKGNYRSDASYPAWLNNLSKRKVDYLFVYSLHQIKGVEFPMEDEWAKANPDRFLTVFTNPTIHIYRILR